MTRKFAMLKSWCEMYQIKFSIFYIQTCTTLYITLIFNKVENWQFSTLLNINVVYYVVQVEYRILTILFGTFHTNFLTSQIS